VSEPTVFMVWCIVVGVLLISMTISGSFVARLPLSAAMLYLLVGFGIGPTGLRLVDVDALRDSTILERMTEVAVLISLFTVGMKLELPLDDRRWRIPVQLASVSMLVTVAAIAATGVYLMGMSLGAAVLLGAILAPTDPVLAADVQVAKGSGRDRLRFGLTGEGGLNDGTAFPFVMLGLGLLSLHELGAGGWRWWTVDVFWGVAGGLGIGFLLGTLVGHGIIYLRHRHREALGSDEFIAFGLIALTYGLALLCQTYGFLAVFAAGLALRRIDDRSSTHAAIALPPRDLSIETAATRRPDTPANMMQAVQRFNAQLERFAEVAIVLVIGALLATVDFRLEVLWFIPLLFVIIRPLAVYLGLIGTGVAGAQRALMAWFGIRGIGSIYYLMYAISHGIEPGLADQLLSITLSVVAASIVAHGVSVTPLMRRYEQRASTTTRAVKTEKPL
jgi:NhaP-type Na+/H+ or K+/H+ antiporter